MSVLANIIMFNWTHLTKDPNDKETGRKFLAFLASIQAFYSSPRSDFLREYFRGMRVLDIGAGEHDPSYYNPEKWEHGIISGVAASAVGVDINPEVCEYYNRKGFRFICADATSEQDLGQRFDRIFMGDVIEHVNNPVALLQFGKRHLEVGGRILLSTPNPFALSFLNARFRKKNKPFLIINYEHVFWVTPTNANELARRAGLQLTRIYLPKLNFNSARRFKDYTQTITSYLLRALGVGELASKEYIYEFTL